MNGADLLARIRLIRSQSIGPVTFRQLLARFGSPEAALAAVPDLAARGRGRPPVLFREDQARREIERWNGSAPAIWCSAKASTRGRWPRSTTRRRC